MELIRRKKFAVTILSSNKEIFIVYIATFNLNPEIHSFHRAQLALFFTYSTFKAILSKYVDFVNVFFLEYISKFPEYTEINNHLIDLVDG